MRFHGHILGVWLKVVVVFNGGSMVCETSETVYASCVLGGVGRHAVRCVMEIGWRVNRGALKMTFAWQFES